MKALAVLLAVPLVAAAQSNGVLHVGARVRLVAVDTIDRTNGQRRVSVSGNLLSIDGQSLVLRRPVEAAPAADAVRVPISTINSAYISVGQRRHTWHGALLGAATGALVGYQTTSDGFADVGAIGFGVGAVAGYFIKRERWQRVDLGQLRLQLGLR